MFDFSQLESLIVPEGKVTQIMDASGRVLWAASGYKAILEVEKITSDTYAGEQTYEDEQFILLDIYPKTNGTVKVTYGDADWTITDESGAEAPNAQQVYFGVFNNDHTYEATPASGELTIEGDYYAFAVGTYRIKSDILNKVTTEYCSCITNIIDWGTLEYIAAGAFANCAKLSVIELPSKITSIGARAFYNCRSLTSITIPNGVTSIGSDAFYSCSLTSITIPEGVTSIEHGLFASCRNLTSVVMPNTVTRISNEAFNMCGSLALTSLPNALINIGMEAFYMCTSLALTSLPSGLTSIGEAAFFGCGNMTISELPSGITSIEKKAFYGCGNMTISELPSGLTSIEDGVFQSCTKITVKSLPSGVTSIGGWGFQNCEAIPSMIIPSGVTSIGKNAFNACAALSSVTFENTSGWYVTQTANATSGINIDVTNATNNVTLLKSTYGNGYYWYRS